MTGPELKQLLNVRPFRPLRLHMTDGRSYDIRRPDNILVLLQRADVGYGDNEFGVVDRVEHISLLHVIRVEELNPTPASSN